MPYNSETEATIVISKQHHEMLRELAKKQKRTLRAATEMLIEEATPLGKS